VEATGVCYLKKLPETRCDTTSQPVYWRHPNRPSYKTGAAA
jgi:hypothetical protein